jgi:predicted pyridoxine 5'-phosphate oxidase superfamily flavin-nucleotide-binding protein
LLSGETNLPDNTAIIMVDYPARARLKIFAKASVLALNDDPALFDLLDLKNYAFRPERIIVFDIEAYDWNCPQHITPRYTLEDIEEIFLEQRTYIETLETELKNLRKKMEEGGKLE